MGGWLWRAGYTPSGVYNDSFITKGLRFCIYKYWLMTKGLRARIYRLGCRYAPSCPDESGRCIRSEMVGHVIEFFKIIPPANRARPEGRAAVCFCLYYIVPVKDFGFLGRQPGWFRSTRLPNRTLGARLGYRGFYKAGWTTELLVISPCLYPVSCDRKNPIAHVFGAVGGMLPFPWGDSAFFGASVERPHSHEQS